MAIKVIQTMAGIIGICQNCDTYFLMNYGDIHKCQETL